jgi:hypothetical protein
LFAHDLMAIDYHQRTSRVPSPITIDPVDLGGTFDMRPNRRTLRLITILAALVPLALGMARVAPAAPAWSNHAGNAQHTGNAKFPAQPLQQIYWSMPVDLKQAGFPIHYGSSLVTEHNTVVVPVKVGTLDTFRVEAQQGSDGTLLWQYQPDYNLPPYGTNWIPSYGPALTPTGRLYLPAAGGTLLYTDTVDSPSTPTFTRVAFYGIANYNANPTGFDSNVRINTPLTSDSQGNVYFGFRATGANPLSLTSGIARMGADGSGTFVFASVATIDSAKFVAFNAAPVLSNDEQKVYAVLKYATNGQGINLVSLDATTLAPIDRARPRDPFTNFFAIESNSGSSTPDGRAGRARVPRRARQRLERLTWLDAAVQPQPDLIGRAGRVRLGQHAVGGADEHGAVVRRHGALPAVHQVQQLRRQRRR